MANLRDIRRRIKSVKNTAQITRAMQLVAAAKMKKAQDKAIAGREYEAKIVTTLKNVSKKTDQSKHRFFGQSDANGKTLCLVVSTDKGLCGALNTHLFKSIVTNNKEETVDYITIGKKLKIQLAKQSANLVDHLTIQEPIDFNTITPLANKVMALFLAGDYQRITIAYNHFVSTMVQKPTFAQLLPISNFSEQDVADNTEHTAEGLDYTFEPSPAKVLSDLLPLFVRFKLYQSLLEAKASEHSARMVSMKAATDNAKGMVDDLTLEYNKLRQAAITAELLEITTAMKAME